MKIKIFVFDGENDPEIRGTEKRVNDFLDTVYVPQGQKVELTPATGSNFFILVPYQEKVQPDRTRDGY